MRLIDADALESKFRTIKIIEVFPEWENLSFQTKHKLAYYGQEVKRIVQNAPTIEAEPVVHGRWIPHNKGQNNWCECSKCNTVGSPFWKRCPVCEAKMDGGEKDV